MSSPFLTLTRSMATLRETQTRLKSIKNIGKITKSMKMIASTKLSRAQRGMEGARKYGKSAEEIFQQAGTVADEKAPSCLVVLSSDKGLCGAIHSSVSKAAVRYIKTLPEVPPIIVVGDRSRAQVSRSYRNNIVLSFNSIGNKEIPTYGEASGIADMIKNSGQKYDVVNIIHNEFKSVIAYEAKTLKVFNTASFENSPKISNYEIDDTILENFQDFSFANAIFWGLLEGHAAEFAARRTAMENATKNADEMVVKLTLLYNRTRQAVVTNELVEIITGASAL